MYQITIKSILERIRALLQSILSGKQKRRLLRVPNSFKPPKTKKNQCGLGKAQEKPQSAAEQDHSKHYYTIPEARTRFSIPRTRLYEFMSAGELPWTQLGGTRRLAHEDLVALMQRHQKKGGKRSEAEEIGQQIEEE